MVFFSLINSKEKGPIVTKSYSFDNHSKTLQEYFLLNSGVFMCVCCV